MKKIVPENAILIPPEAKRVFEGVIFDVYHRQLKMYDGTMATFEWLKRPDTVLAVCIVDDKILVVEDEQPRHGKLMKLPGGRVDPEDNSIMESVKREVREETGYEFANWRLVDVTQPETKIEWFVHVYVADGVTRQQLAQHDDGERIVCTSKVFHDMKRLVSEGVGMLKYSRELFGKVENLEALRTLPEFHGKAIDR